MCVPQLRSDLTSIRGTGLTEEDERRWYTGCPLEVRPVPYKGRGLFATKDVKKGDVLLQSVPYAWAVYETYKQTTCRYCLRDRAEGAAPYEWMCAHCKDTWYCSQRCQQLDSGVHLAEECKVMQEWELDPKSYTPDTISEMKFLLRTLSCKTYEKSIDAKPQPGVLLYQDYAHLVARATDFDASTTDALRFWIADYLAKLRKWLGHSEEPEELMDILVRNRRNSFYVASCHATKPPVACALYVNPSFFNHSCSPNVTYQTTPELHRPRIFVYLADADMPKDSELCITYLDETSIVKDVTERRRLLHESFRFTCGCVRCTQEESEAKERAADPKYTAWTEAHKLQLKAMDLPLALWHPLYTKLCNDVLDAGKVFEFLPSGEDQHALSELSVFSKAPIKANSDVFLIDHAWSTTLLTARKQLRTEEGCLHRVEQLLQLNKGEEEEEGEGEEAGGDDEAKVEPMFDDRIKQILASADVTNVELDGGSLTSLPVDELAPLRPGLEKLSLCNQQIADLAALAQQLRAFPSLRALWLSGNPVCDAAGYKEAVLQACPQLEILDSRFTSRYTAWAVKFASKREATDLTDREIVSLKAEHFLPSAVPALRTLDVRRNAFANLLSDLLNPLKGATQLRSLWLDRGAVSRAEVFAQLPQLHEVNGAAADEESDVDKETEVRVQRVLEAMWLRNQCYKLGGADGVERAEVWYIMDEVGSRISHSDAPNFVVHPLFVLDKQLSFSVAWPVKDIGAREAVTRDFLPDCKKGPERDARLGLWFPTYRNAVSAACEQLNAARQVKLAQLTAKYEENVARNKFAAQVPPAAPIANATPLKVFCNIQLVRDAFAKRPEFVIVADDSTADVVWLYEQIADFGSIRPSVYVNQIPNEEAITLKDMLQHTVHTTMGRPPWYPLSFNLRDELLPFLGEYARREAAGEPNTWIVKPWNLARGIGHVISADQGCILRQLETGPRVASLYVTNPLLYNRRKIDFRYMVLVRSGPQPEAFVYKKFLTRIAPNEYKNDAFEDYTRHFTVMTFTDFKLLEVTHDEYLKAFEAQYGAERWSAIQQRVYDLVRELLVAAYTKQGGLVRDSHYFSLYGFDILVDESLNAHLLEVNFAPNCERFQRYYNFMDQVLSLLFLSSDKEQAFERVM